MGWAANELGHPFRSDPAETKTYIIYVHGWRWSPEKTNNRTETVFKRLWHLGYKGRLAALRWPTFYGGTDDDDREPAGIFTYNNSEYRAWKSGESLKLYVNQLPTGYTRHVVAHSMGNIVAGAALKNGMSVANYIMLNAAVPAMCYDESASLRQLNWNYTTPNTDPDAGTRSLAYIGKFGTLNTNVVNFFLNNDSATRTLWEINNSIWRPHRYNLGTTGYGYDPSAIVGRRLYITFFTAFGRYLIDPHEAMPYASQSLTRTVGADGRTRGSIGSVVDLDASFGFGDEHGAEWERTFYATRAFYIELMRTLQIPAQL